MSKKLFALALAAAMSVSLLAGCGSSSSSTGSTSTGSASTSTEAGKVYYLNFKPEADAAWQELAKTYTEQTGVEVKVVTAAGGNYSDTLTAEMAKSEAPTLFQCGNAQGLLDWGDYCIDFTGTKVLDEMTTSDFNLSDENGAVKAIGYCYEAFGIIVNKALLAEAGYELADITNFETLKAVAEDIHARAGELGFDAFTSAGLDSSSSWRFSGHLTNMPLFYEGRDAGWTACPATVEGTYLANYKNIWDLYMNNSLVAPTTLATGGYDAENEFATGKAVFYQNGSWEYANLVTSDDTGYHMNAEDLAMIPIYCGVEGEENAGLCYGTENFWAVNSKASEADIQATLDFMLWMVTSDKGTACMAEQFGEIPFKGAAENPNIFIQNATQYVADGKYSVTWTFTLTPNVNDWRAAIVSALTQYCAGGDWADVETAFVAGWATQYQAANG